MQAKWMWIYNINITNIILLQNDREVIYEEYANVIHINVQILREKCNIVVKYL